MVLNIKWNTVGPDVCQVMQHEAWDDKTENCQSVGIKKKPLKISQTSKLAISVHKNSPTGEAQKSGKSPEVQGCGGFAGSRFIP